VDCRSPCAPIATRKTHNNRPCLPGRAGVIKCSSPRSKLVPTLTWYLALAWWQKLSNDFVEASDSGVPHAHFHDQSKLFPMVRICLVEWAENIINCLQGGA
jgi:hypothetical protein